MFIFCRLCAVPFRIHCLYIMDIQRFETDVKTVADALRGEFQVLRGNRPSPKMVEDIKVDCYGQMMTVKQLGSISVVPPREINISLWDQSTAAAVAKAVEASSLNVPANVSGNVIRINLPQLTDERKREMEKVVRKMAEERRIRIRALREEANKEIKKMEEAAQLSEDAAFKKKEEVQKAVDAANKEIERLLDAKVQELA